MSNASQPCRSFCETDPRTSVCVHCDHAACTSCGAPVAREDARPVAWVPGDAAPGMLCLTCLAGGEDSDGVPLPVGDEDTAPVEEQTRPLAYEPIGAEGLGDVRARRAA